MSGGFEGHCVLPTYVPSVFALFCIPNQVKTVKQKEEGGDATQKASITSRILQSTCYVHPAGVYIRSSRRHDPAFSFNRRKGLHRDKALSLYVGTAYIM